MKDKKDNKYRLVLVLDPKLSDKDKILKKVVDWLEKKEIEVAKEHLGIKDLVYEISKNNKGDFWSLDLSSGLSLILKEFNILLNRETGVIRYLILKKE